jgi:hypothetical protein
MITYTLTEAELSLAEETGLARTARARGANLEYSKKAEVQSQNFIDLNGAAGEIAFVGMLLNIGFITKEQYKKKLTFIRDAGITSARYGQDDGDVVLNDIKIDVKTTQYPQGTLWITNNKRGAFKIDAYVLMTGDATQVKPEFTFRGYMEAKEALGKWDNRMTPGKFWQDELHPLPGEALVPAYLKEDTEHRYYGNEQDRNIRILTHFAEEAYDAREADEESPMVEAAFVKTLGRSSRYYARWLVFAEDCGVFEEMESAGYSWEEKQLFNVIDEIAQEQEDDLLLESCDIDSLVDALREARSEEEHTEQLELSFK